NRVVLYRDPRGYELQRPKRQATGTRASFRTILQTPCFVPILFVLFAGTFTNRSYQPLIPLFVASVAPSQDAVASLTGFIVAGGALAAALSANVADPLLARLLLALLLLVSLLISPCGAALVVLRHHTPH